VDKGIIENCKMYGDFFGVGEVAEIESKLKGIKYEKSQISAVLDEIDVKHYFGNISKEDFLQLIY
jgi:lipoate---protein ligase